VCDPASPCMMCSRAASLDAMRRASARDEATLRECGIDVPRRPQPAPPEFREGLSNGLLLAALFYAALLAGWLLLRAWAS
jgi:hypothetical protein